MGAAILLEMKSEHRVFLIMALIGLLGAILGSAVSYFGEKAISDSSLSHEEEQDHARVRGVARVYKESLEVGAETLEADEQHGSWPSRAEAVLFELPSLDVRSSIAAELSTTAMASVTRADHVMHDVVSASYERQDQSLSESDRKYIGGYIPVLKEGAAALSPVAGESSSSDTTASESEPSEGETDEAAPSGEEGSPTTTEATE
jgi:hypothetical protein